MIFILCEVIIFDYFANVYTLEVRRLQYFVVIKTDPLWHMT